MIAVHVSIRRARRQRVVRVQLVHDTLMFARIVGNHLVMRGEVELDEEFPPVNALTRLL